MELELDDATARGLIKHGIAESLEIEQAIQPDYETKIIYPKKKRK